MHGAHERRLSIRYKTGYNVASPLCCPISTAGQGPIGVHSIGGVPLLIAY